MSLEEAIEATKELEQECSETEYHDTSFSESSRSSEDSNAVTSNFASLYKTKPTMTQEKRREKLLQEIKLRRSQTVDEKRGFAELFSEDESIKDLEIPEPQPEAMDVERQRRPRKRKKKKISNKLMLSEWFTEIPGDLEYNWLVKLCPAGTRNLVVATKKMTKAYTKKGFCQSKFLSHLPGGGPQTSSYGKFTVLDCIFNPETQCYYVLDIIAWNNFSLRTCDTDLRFYWLKSKLEETPELREKTALNKHCFYEVQYFPAELPLVQDKLAKPLVVNDETLSLDGVLFYHRETDYIESSTPLVGWLKPFMIPEMLNIPVDESFMKMKPEGYTSLQQYNSSRKYRNRRVNAAPRVADIEEME